jgi:hypothetical protein
VAQTGPIGPDDLAVTLAVRNDLGAGHDEAVLAEFLDRVGAAIDARVDERLDERLASRRAYPGLPADPRSRPSTALGFASIGMGIPITAITLGADGAAGVIATAVAWTGIAAVNLAYARRR